MSLIGRSRSSAFRLSTMISVDVAPRLALLFGIGTKALPSWDSKTRWSDLLGGLTVRLTVGLSRHANSPHPSSREGHAREGSLAPNLAATLLCASAKGHWRPTHVQRAHALYPGRHSRSL